MNRQHNKPFSLNPVHSTDSEEANRYKLLGDRHPGQQVYYHFIQEYDSPRIIKVKTIDGQVVSKISKDDRELLLLPDDPETKHYTNILNAYNQPTHTTTNN